MLTSELTTDPQADTLRAFKDGDVALWMALGQILDFACRQPRFGD